jgi:hypothetical protein
MLAVSPVAHGDPLSSEPLGTSGSHWSWGGAASVSGSGGGGGITLGIGGARISSSCAGALADQRERTIVSRRDLRDIFNIWGWWEGGLGNRDYSGLQRARLGGVAARPNGRAFNCISPEGWEVQDSELNKESNPLARTISSSRRLRPDISYRAIAAWVLIAARPAALRAEN